MVTAARTAPPAPARVPGSGKLRLTRRGRIVFTLLAALPVVIGVVAIGLNAGGAVASSTVVETNFEYATIGAGETLWQLAVSLAPNADPRDVIAEIKSLNGLNSSAVQAGQRLAIPLRYTAQ
ncbi:LysM peptidoglycan-binding domain-containing protein [Mycetocola spongiae]|nr:LysM peptidoglycan-binding domain-containing protein [Mycetocola spongiae]